MTKRPSKTQILARQARLARYQRETRKTDKELASEFNVSLQQLRNFQRRPSEQRKGWSQNKASQKLYSAMGAPSGKGSTRVKGVRVSMRPVDREILNDIRTTQNRQFAMFQYIQEIRYKTEQQIWREYADAQGLPHSYYAIRDMYQSGEISSREYYAAVRKLHEAYGRRGKK